LFTPLNDGLPPGSLFSMQIVRQLSGKTEAGLDKRRFRANVYVDLGLGEDEFVAGHCKFAKSHSSRRSNKEHYSLHNL
jgi:hypothetical protein